MRPYVMRVMMVGCTGLGIATLVLADDAQQNAIKEELIKLDGTWKAVSVVFNGQDVTNEERAYPGPFTISQGRVSTVGKDGKKVESVLRIDPTQSPKTCDENHLSGPLKGKTLHGIYKLEGDKLTTCYTIPGGGRPAGFESKPDSGVLLVVSKRQKN